MIIQNVFLKYTDNPVLGFPVLMLWVVRGLSSWLTSSSSKKSHLDSISAWKRGNGWQRRSEMLSFRRPASIPGAGTGVCRTVFQQVHVGTATTQGGSLPPIFSNAHALLPFISIEERGSPSYQLLTQGLGNKPWREVGTRCKHPPSRAP